MTNEKDGLSHPVRHRYQTIEFDGTDIHVRTLRDRQQFSDPGNMAQSLGVSHATWPLFGVIWDSAEILARLMLMFDVRGKHILEVGCGIGLPSLILNSRTADITATDHHPEARAYLDLNSKLNDDPLIPFTRTGWEDPTTALGQFDLIIGSDLLYQPDHPGLLAEFLNQHARAHCQVIIVDPARGNTARFTQHMTALGFVLQDNLNMLPYLLPGQVFKGQIKSYLR